MSASSSLNPKAGVLALSGYGLRIVVDRGHLVVEDGVGNERRHGRFARVPRLLKRIVVLGHSGIISFDALRWIQDVGAAFVQIDTDGRVIAVTSTSGLDDARLRRAQALATTNGIGIRIGRDLIRQKLTGQLRIAQRLSASDRAVREIKECIEEIDDSDSPDELRRAEGQAAIAYWSAWREVPVKFDAGSVKRVPEHWLSFGRRHSLISNPTPRRAINPANAVLNYLYAILEAEARIAALRMGLDPGLGLLHADQRARDSLSCDLMEAVRPKVDEFVLDLLASRTFHKSDLFETREGICRLMPPFTHQLSETGQHWARELGPLTELVAQQLFEGIRRITNNNFNPKALPNNSFLPTLLTESHRSEGRESYKRKSTSKTVDEMRAELFK
jgi:CRISPR-associated endonuclease Cas1